MDLSKVEINDFGGAPFAEHNHPCSVCHVQPSVLQMWNGMMQPCHGCQSKGFKTVQLPKWLRRFFE